MKITDRVYGYEEINEPVLLELIDSKPMQRLKEISQAVPSEYFYRKIYTRFEHSLGVLILLRRLNASLKEQISGLLHDISHTTFSHTVDWAIGDSSKQDFQDSQHLRIIENSEIPLILDKYGFDYKEIANTKNFSLLEKDAPALCADRIDYCLRDAVILDIKPKASLIFENLINYKGNIAFKDLNLAREFADLYMDLNNQHWAGRKSTTTFYLFGDILKQALDKNIITRNDFFTTDKEVINKILNSKYEKIILELELIKKGFDIASSNLDEGIELKSKYRFIDPEILLDGRLVQLGDIDNEYKNKLKNDRIEFMKVQKVRVIPI